MALPSPPRAAMMFLLSFVELRIDGMELCLALLTSDLVITIERYIRAGYLCQPCNYSCNAKLCANNKHFYSGLFSKML